MGVLRHLIVVLPGIGGSVLAGPEGLTAWDVTAGDIPRAVIDPGNLAIERELVPTGLVESLTVLRRWLVVPGYEGLTHHLRRGFGAGLGVVDYSVGEPVPAGTDVLRVPYDFRRSIVESADHLGRAVTAAVGESGRRVVVVAHSMGGLVARYWVGACGGWRHCRGLVTLGTPHRGAPRALDWLFNGVCLGVLRLRAVTRVLRDWPSMYELLPQYPAVLPEVGEPLEPTGLAADLVRPLGSPHAGAVVLRRAAAAARVHADLAAAWEEIPGGRQPGVWPYFGRGHTTLNRAVVRRGRVRVAKADPEWRSNVGWLGDGTVPAISSIPVELSELPEIAQAVADKHGAMGSTAQVMERLVTMQGEDLPIRVSARPAMPWVGWDADEIVATETEIELGAKLHYGAAGPQNMTGSAATIVVSGAAAPVSAGMTLQEQGWRVVLPPLRAGTYQLDIEVKDAWYGTSVYASTPLAVDDAGEEGPA